jgi:hypothetical protein
VGVVVQENFRTGRFQRKLSARLRDGEFMVVMLEQDSAGGQVRVPGRPVAEG